MFSPGVNLVEAGFLLWTVSQEIDLSVKNIWNCFFLKNNSWFTCLFPFIVSMNNCSSWLVPFESERSFSKVCTSGKLMSGKQIIDQWKFCAVQKPYLLILANLQSNKRQKKEALRFSHQHFAYTHLSQSEIFHSCFVLYKNHICWF